MTATKVHTAVFSPTGTTRKLVSALAQSLSAEAPAVVHDLTYPPGMDETVVSGDHIAVIGVPVYAGRVAPLAAQRLKRFRGQKTPAVVVVVYGNREFEDALVELRDIAEWLSFEVIAGCSFIGEHSFSSTDSPIAQARPDAADLVIAREFGMKIGQLIQSEPTRREHLHLPGNVPYLAATPTIPFTPKVDEEICTLCGACQPLCPGGAIAITDAVSIDVENCIHCCACIKICPVDAVSIHAPPLLEKKHWLHENCSTRKEPQLFI